MEKPAIEEWNNYSIIPNFINRIDFVNGFTLKISFKQETET